MDQKIHRALMFPTLALSVLVNDPAKGAGLGELFIDEDGWFDGSRFLEEYPYSVLPVASVITEPAIGTGLVLAGAHFHDRGEGVAENELDSKGRPISRSVTALAVGATDNDTWFVGSGHFGHYKQGNIRYEGLVGYADIKLDFYGTVEEANRHGISFNIQGTDFWQLLAFRLWDSNWFAGGAYHFLNTQTHFGVDGEIPGVGDDALDSNNASIAGVLLYDSLDNPYTPGNGIMSELEYARFDEAVGGDFNYDQVTWLNQVHFTLATDWTLGLRADLDVVDGEPPFYALPYIDLKGIPALRYQAENVISSEARLNWSFHPRWQAAVFAGAGRAADGSIGDLSDAPSRVTRGVGFRYMGVRKLGLNFGLDYAEGPEDNVIYVAFGTSW